MSDICAEKTRVLPLLLLLLLASPGLAQTYLFADGTTDTYSLIASVLGGDPIESPDCSHPDFGPHITQAWDDDLGMYTFVFYIHVTPDNDRCTAFDRQRNEIKTYGPSPAYLKGMYGDVCNYRWKFKLDAAFQPSPNFTHIHQIKAGDGTDSDSPIITITPRSATPERLEIIYTAPTGLSGSGTKTTAPLANFKGQWIEAFERTLYSSNGTYELSLRRVSDGFVLLSYTNDNLNMWRGDATFNRPKWGIYRSLNSSNYLRDEQVLFANFCIGKGNDICPSDIKIPTPKIASIRVLGTSLVFSGSNGVPGRSYYLVSSTNLALPLTQWQPIASNIFDPNGNFNITNPSAVNLRQQFFR